MNTKFVLTVLVVIGAIASIAMVTSLSQTQTIEAETKKGNEMYVFAEGIYPQAVFKFRDGAVTHDFQLFTQNNNLFSTLNGGISQKTAIPEFTLQKVPGDTPLLHKAADQTWEYQGRTTPIEYPYREFDVTVNLTDGDKTIRSFEYKKCGITNYKVVTESDKQKGHTKNEGFALMEQYTFQCNGYAPKNTYGEHVKASLLT